MGELNVFRAVSGSLSMGSRSPGKAPFFFFFLLSPPFKISLEMVGLSLPPSLSQGLWSTPWFQKVMERVI